MKDLLKAVAEAAAESVAQTSGDAQQASSTGSGDETLRYVGPVEGAQGVVDMHVRRFSTPVREVFDISGSLRTPAGVWRFNVDGHSGYGKLHDETVVYMEFDRQHLALTINPYNPPAPTYRFRRA